MTPPGSASMSPALKSEARGHPVLSTVDRRSA